MHSSEIKCRSNSSKLKQKKKHLERKVDFEAAEEGRRQGRRSISGGLIAKDSTEKFDFALREVHFFSMTDVKNKNQYLAGITVLIIPKIRGSLGKCS